MHPGLLHDSMFRSVIDMAVEGDGIGDTQARGPVDKAVMPPATADDVEVQSVDPRPQLGHGIECVLDLLVRHQPRQHDNPGGATTVAR